MRVRSVLIGAGYQQNRWHAPFRLFNSAVAGSGSRVTCAVPVVPWYLLVGLYRRGPRLTVCYLIIFST
jgi:hypothetical protein